MNHLTFELFIMVLYSCEGIDIDRKLGFPGAPPPKRPTNGATQVFNEGYMALLDTYNTRRVVDDQGIRGFQTTPRRVQSLATVLSHGQI